LIAITFYKTLQTSIKNIQMVSFYQRMDIYCVKITDFQKDIMGYWQSSSSIG